MPTLTPPIPPRDRLIVALDVPQIAAAQLLVEKLGHCVSFYKVGMGMFMGGEGFTLLRFLRHLNKKVFVDMKFFDVPETVGSAVSALSQHGADMCTVHGNQSMMEAAAAKKGDMKILAVTALTSLDQADMKDLGFGCDIHSLVLSRARRALEAGCDGVVSSGLEASAIRQQTNEKLIIVTPGIRPVENRPVDDQKRTVDAATAFAQGADYIVVGRPIYQAADPLAVAQKMQQTIDKIFA